MSDITNNIQRLQSIAAGARRELKTLDIKGRNSISLIRSKLDLLNLDDGEDLAALDLESVEVEFNELKENIARLLEVKDKCEDAEKEIKKIKKQLE
jgi:hypothetical protein